MGTIVFFMLASALGFFAPVPAAAPASAPLHSPPREFHGKGVCGSTTPEDTEWHCGGSEPLPAEFAGNFRFEASIVFQGLKLLDDSLTFYLPDGMTLMFLSTKRCQNDKDCVPYVALLVPPPQAKEQNREFKGWVIRINYPERLTYIRQGDVVRVELDDGREVVKWPEIRVPSQNPHAPAGVMAQAHGVNAQIMGWMLTPFSAAPAPVPTSAP